MNIHQNVVQNNICEKCIKQNMTIQKFQSVILRLQKRCAQKSAEIKRLRAVGKRSKFAKKSLEEMLNEMKKNKWITNEGQEIMSVN